MIIYPCLIIEILTRGTEEYDRHDKFTAYQSIITLQEYLLVSSEKIQVEYFRKETANQWQRELYNTADAQMNLLNGDVILSAAEIYKNVKL
jgi:Uma2 family endonuclease